MAEQLLFLSNCFPCKSLYQFSASVVVVVILVVAAAAVKAKPKVLIRQ
jgi:hypothetical protein